ncbi:EF-hand domain-containing protein [Sphingopyxis sp. PET50]|uniref:EF-hand domain-containing protein n=1 Tax=Sphingopyxis sp. PET50 TaxID=2976533 RepID=UPI0021AFC527|nr:hypothetical protein [Sphingopyxis sp. PET50]
MKKKISFLTLGAALVAVPVLAAPGADGNAPATRAEAQAKATAMFAKLDANGDGKLDAADRAAKRAEMQAKAFERLDADKDGNVSKAEWDQASADRQAKRTERLEKRAEAGEPGKRGPGLRGHHGRRGGHHGMRGGMMMKADTDGDKAISAAEFQTAALARFDAADANKDGQVTAEERKAQRDAWKAKAGEWRAKRGAAQAAPAGE